MQEPRAPATDRQSTDAAPPCQDLVPPAKAERERFRTVARRYLAAHRLVPPLSVDELRSHANAVLTATGADEKYRKFAAVVLGSEAWRDRVAAVPFARRLLLLPKCLRAADQCAAAVDAIGLICGECGRCPIGDLKKEAERLGYVVLVAEGSPTVMALLAGGQIQAVVGVSCLAVLEAMYPIMESAAVPGVAIPLLYDGCADTEVDLDWVWEAVRASGGNPSPYVDLDALRNEVEAWFTGASLAAVMGPAPGETEQIARAWLARSGKRWRPLLAAGVFRAMADDPVAGGQAVAPEDVRRIALAVECFHKASLIHDDIEDEDATRYGEKTLHEQYGVPVALNVGDFLLGEGYRLIAESGLPADRKAEMFRVAAGGHRDLAVGQGAELCWTRRPIPLSPQAVLDIFSRKTAPAFEVALRLGALTAGAADGVWEILHRYSEALGIAYQIHDDLVDWDGEGEPSDARAIRPSILLAIARERAEGDDLRFLEAVWRRQIPPEAAADRLHRIFDRLGVRQETWRLLESHKAQAVRCLEPVSGAALKGLLRRVIFNIFLRHGPKGSLGEFEVRHAPRRTPRSGDDR